MNDKIIAKLIIETGFAAVNYGLRREIMMILEALPVWVDDTEQRTQCEAVLLFGLGKYHSVAECLDNVSPEDCKSLRSLLQTINKG